MPIPDKPAKPTFVLGSRQAFVNYRRERPEMWLIHVQTLHDADGYEGEALIILDPNYTNELYVYALSRVR